MTHLNVTTEMGNIVQDFNFEQHVSLLGSMMSLCHKGHWVKLHPETKLKQIF